jgi:hypothetical protein
MTAKQYVAEMDYFSPALLDVGHINTIHVRSCEHYTGESRDICPVIVLDENC